MVNIRALQYKMIQLIMVILRRITPRLWNRAIAVLLAIFIVNSIAIFILTYSASFNNADDTVIFTLIYSNIALLFILFLGFITRLTRSLLFKQWGGRIQIKLLVTFSLIASIPAIGVMFFSLIFLDLGLENWFSNRVRQALDESVQVANAYLEEHIKNIGSDALNLARRFDRDYIIASPSEQNNQLFVQELLSWHARSLNLEEAYIFNRQDVIARYGLTYTLELQTMNQADLVNANAGEVIILHDNEFERIRALVALDSMIDGFLVVARYVDPLVLHHVNTTQEAASSYQFIELKRFNTKISFSIIFILLTLILLSASVLYGLHFSTSIATRLYKLVNATQQVRRGHLIEIEDTRKKRDEISYLFIMFNRMVKRLTAQRKQITQTSQQVDERRRFIETILANVSAGIIGLDQQGAINLVNKKASHLLGDDIVQYTHKRLDTVLPAFAPLWHRLQSQKNALSVQDTIMISTKQGDKTLLVKIGTEQDNNKIDGYIVTFDDVSNLIQAQHQAAWSEVARRIAHEVKNPLTPIQLSAERLMRKYKHLIDEDDTIFQQCINTIIRQVDDLGFLIDEFSDFARMPAPNMAQHNIVEILREALFLEQNHQHNIEYHFIYDKEASYMVQCDKSLTLQSLTNILKNARESILSLEQKTGIITINLSTQHDDIMVAIQDNGTGFHSNIPLENYTKPYVTTKDEGTGLGLSIVKKIMHDQSGRFAIDNVIENDNIIGAKIILHFMKA